MKRPSERDFERDPYSPAETRVARWFFNRGVGGGDDPIGALIASHEMVVAERNALRAEIRRLRRASGEETKR